MKISIAQLVSGELLSQLNQSVPIAHRDGSDLVVYPAFTFETPADPVLEYNNFGVALYVAAMILHDTRENPIHLLFPYMSHKGATLLAMAMILRSILMMILPILVSSTRLYVSKTNRISTLILLLIRFLLVRRFSILMATQLDVSSTLIPTFLSKEMREIMLMTPCSISIQHL